MGLNIAGLLLGIGTTRMTRGLYRSVQARLPGNEDVPGRYALTSSICTVIDAEELVLVYMQNRNSRLCTSPIRRNISSSLGPPRLESVTESAHLCAVSIFLHALGSAKSDTRPVSDLAFHQGLHLADACGIVLQIESTSHATSRTGRNF